MAFAADYAAPGGGAYECPTSSMGWPVLRRGRGTGRRHRAAGCALRQREPADYDRPQVSPGATAPLACRLRVGIPVKWTRAEGPQSHRVRRSCAIRRPARADHGCGHPPHAAHPHPRAGGRGDGQRAAGAGTGRRRRTGEARVMATRARGLRASGSESPGIIARDGRAAHMAARRRPGAVAAHRPALPDNHGRSRTPHVAHPHPHAGARGEGHGLLVPGTGRRQEDARRSAQDELTERARHAEASKTTLKPLAVPDDRRFKRIGA